MDTPFTVELRRGQSSLVTPREEVYPVPDREVRVRLGIDDE
jgi:hypothetical protein